MGSTVLERVPLTGRLKDNSTNSLSLVLSRRRKYSFSSNEGRGKGQNEEKNVEKAEEKEEKEMLAGERIIFYLHGLSWVSICQFLFENS